VLTSLAIAPVLSRDEYYHIENAAKIYQQAIKSNIPGSYDIALYESLAIAYEQMREFKKARRVYEKLIKLYPGSKDVKEWRESIDFLRG